MEIFLLGWILCALPCALIANSKGRSAITWLVLGGLFGIFALLTVGFMAPADQKKDKPNPRTHAICPHCKEYVLLEACVCKHCGLKLVPQEPEKTEWQQFVERMKSQPN